MFTSPIDNLNHYLPHYVRSIVKVSGFSVTEYGSVYKCRLYTIMKKNNNSSSYTGKVA